MKVCGRDHAAGEEKREAAEENGVVMSAFWAGCQADC